MCDVVNLILYLFDTSFNDGFGNASLTSYLCVGKGGEILNVGVVISLEVTGCEIISAELQLNAITTAVRDGGNLLLNAERVSIAVNEDGIANLSTATTVVFTSDEHTVAC